MSFLSKIAKFALPAIGSIVAPGIGTIIGGALGGAVGGGGIKGALLGAGEGALGNLAGAAFNGSIGSGLGGLGHALLSPDSGNLLSGFLKNGFGGDPFSVSNVADMGVDIGDDFGYSGGDSGALGSVFGASAKNAGSSGGGLLDGLFSGKTSDLISLASILSPLFTNQTPAGTTSQQDIQNQIAQSKAQDAKINQSMYAALNAPALDRQQVNPISHEDYFTYGSGPQKQFFNEVNPKMNAAPAYADGGAVAWGQAPASGERYRSAPRSGPGSNLRYGNDQMLMSRPPEVLMRMLTGTDAPSQIAQGEDARRKMITDNIRTALPDPYMDPLTGKVIDHQRKLLTQFQDPKMIAYYFGNDANKYSDALDTIGKGLGVNNAQGLVAKMPGLGDYYNGAQSFLLTPHKRQPP